MDDTPFLAGFKVMPILKSEIAPAMADVEALGIHYGLGDKEKSVMDWPPTAKLLDCSGFMRVFVYHLTGGKVIMPDGSYNQLDYLTQGGYKKSDFESCGLIDDVVRICIMEQPGGIGHIWMVYQGRTYECHGGTGPGTRAWNDSILVGIKAHTTVFAIA